MVPVPCQGDHEEARVFSGVPIVCSDCSILNLKREKMSSRLGSSMSEKGFGKPKPLPNEEGYKAEKETVRLERESKEMEARLQMLQLRMQQQREDDAAAPKIGGSRWKSGRMDKGGVRGYARDVQEKIKRSEQRIETKRQQKTNSSLSQKPMMSMTTGSLDMAALAGGVGAENELGRVNQAKAPAAAMGGGGMKAPVSVVSPSSGADSAGSGGEGGEAFRRKEINSWTVEDVTQWLKSVQLSQYVSQFQENEINGPILLEISLEDLDYMGVKILGHRKVLLKGIEDLRKNKRVTISLQAPLSPSKNADKKGPSNVYESLDDPNPNSRKYAPRVPVTEHGSLVKDDAEGDDDEANKVHWSKVEPFQQQQEKRGLKNDVDALHHSNPADGDIDEEEERRLFQDAVAEWRGQPSVGTSGPPKVKIFRDGKEVERKDGGEEQQKRAQKEAHANGMWMNPFGGDVDANSDLLSDSSPTTHTQPLPGSSSTVGGQAQSSSLLEAAHLDLDEAAERAAFAAAVAEWRGGGKSGSSNNKNEEQGSGVATGTTSGGSGAPGAGGQAIAEQLARQMEQEQKAVESEMNQKMAELTAKLSAAKLAAAAQAKAEAEEGTAGAGGDFDDSVDSGTASKADVSFSYVHETRPVNHGPAAALTPREEVSSYNGDDAPLSPMLSDAEDDDAYFGAAAAMSGGTLDQQQAAVPTSKPVISMVETSFGAEELDKVADEEAYYVVEEDSDED